MLSILAVVPLWAPYELLVRPGWPNPAGPFFAFAALVSAGAVAVAMLFLVAALTGTSSSLVFDRRTATITSTAQAPLVRRKSRVAPLQDVVAVEIGDHEWSDGGPTFHVRVAMADGLLLRTGATPSRHEAELVRGQVVAFLATPSIAVNPSADA
jgi:hypothetical protein